MAPDPSRTDDQTASPVQDDNFIMDMDENEEYVTFTLRFSTYGEHAVEVYVGTGQRQARRRLYEIIGQFLFDVRPQNDPPGMSRILTEVIEEPVP